MLTPTTHSATSTPAAASGEHLAAYGRHLRHLAVWSYSDTLLPELLHLASRGTNIQVFGSPHPLAGSRVGPLHFCGETVWDWLGAIDSLFNERAYLAAHPDVAAAVADGGISSGWAHFALFGQFEGRPAATGYCAGLADFDAILISPRDFGAAIPCLSGRLQAHHQILIWGENASTVQLPPDARLRRLAPDFAVVHRAPAAWIGPIRPTTERTIPGNWPRLEAATVFAPPVALPAHAWPKISVVTVSYNQADYLEETLRSVLDQSYPNLEYIVIDGGSSDRSQAIIERYAGKLAYWVSEKDRGQSHALNKGFARATGQILTWLNSDDRLAPGSLLAVADAFLRHRPDIVVGRCARVRDRELLPFHIHRCRLPLGRIAPLPLAGLLDLQGGWLAGHFFHQPEVFFTRELFDRSGGIISEDLYYSMDYDLWVRMARAGATALAIPEITTIFRQHDRQKTGGDDLPYLPELRQVNARHLALSATSTTAA